MQVGTEIALFGNGIDIGLRYNSAWLRISLGRDPGPVVSERLYARPLESAFLETQIQSSSFQANV
jgi:hypothetical protein